MTTWLSNAWYADRWQICEFMRPALAMIDVDVAPVGTGASIESHDQGVRGMVADFMTPESEASHHYFWGMARNFDPADAGFTARLKRPQGGVCEEDRPILEARQRAITANPGLKLSADRINEVGVHARQLIGRAIAAGRQDAGAPYER